MQYFTKMCDVLVIGAGPAGCAASLAAVKSGAQVILVDSERQLGGTIEKAKLTTFCGFFKNDLRFPELLNPHGITLAITGKLKADGYEPIKYGRVWLQPFPENFMRDFFMPHINAASSLEFYPQSTVSKFTIHENIITDVYVNSASVRFLIKPRAIIDCTGIGLPSSSLPQIYYTPEKSPLNQAAAVTFLLRNSTRLDRFQHLELLYKLKKTIASGELPGSCAVTSFENGFASGEIIGRINLPDDTSKTQFRTIIQHDIPLLVIFLQKNMPGFEHSEFLIPHMELSHRIGLRIHGKYELTESDIIDGRTFDDGHIEASWPIEEWNPVTGHSLRYLSSAYEIPDRSLISSQCSNLFAGGGTVSSTEQAHASLRVCGTVFASGERAGYLAAAKLSK